MADEMSLKADGKREGSTKECSAWMTGEIQERDWTPGKAADIKPDETNIHSDILQATETSTAPLFSVKMHLRRSSSTSSSIADTLSSSQQSHTGVDCAGLVLNCLFCRFYDMILMLPDYCKECWPGYKQVNATDPPTGGDDDSCLDLDCGLFGACDEATDCLELAMEVSEICYH